MGNKKPVSFDDIILAGNSCTFPLIPTELTLSARSREEPEEETREPRKSTTRKEPTEKRARVGIWIWLWRQQRTEQNTECEAWKLS